MLKPHDTVITNTSFHLIKSKTKIFELKEDNQKHDNHQLIKEETEKWTAVVQIYKRIIQSIFKKANPQIHQLQFRITNAYKIWNKIYHSKTKGIINKRPQ